MQEKHCIYKDEQYSARDNGEVLRHPRAGKKPRPTDNQWTFGKPNDKTGYMEIATVRVHRIIATAFHGCAPTKDHVVDHIDTNKRNNRPENLRWVTRLENILLNPITVKRIELVCGSVEAFLADPASFRDKFPDPNYNWMCAVSKEEAKTSLDRMLTWAKSDNRPSGGTLGQWIFDRSTPQEEEFQIIPIVPQLTISLTPNAAQRNWSTPSEFPCCPQKQTEEPIVAYANNLKEGLLFCCNNLFSSLVFKSALSEDRKSLFVMTKSVQDDAIKPWALAAITYEDGLFVHTTKGTYFEEAGAEKYFTLAQGLEWLGGDSIDDYC